MTRPNPLSKMLPSSSAVAAQVSHWIGWNSFGGSAAACGLHEISSHCFPTVSPPPRHTSAQHLARNLEEFLISFYMHTYCPYKKVRLYYNPCVVGGLCTAVQQTTCSLSTLWELCCLKHPVIFCHQDILEFNYINKQQRRANRFLQKTPRLPAVLG